MTIKIYECGICKGFVKNKLKGQERFKGTRKEVRKHLVEVHKIKGKKNQMGVNKKEFGKSDISKKLICEDVKDE